jgi:hypothetical protein
MSTKETAAELLGRKAVLLKEMAENCPPARRDAIGREIKAIDEKLNSVDPAKPTRAAGITGSN